MPQNGPSLRVPGSVLILQMIEQREHPRLRLGIRMDLGLLGLGSLKAKQRGLYENGGEGVPHWGPYCEGILLFTRRFL